MSEPLRVVFFGSGEFGLPTLQRLFDEHTLELVVSQPDRRAGRGRKLSPTPIAQLAQQHETEVTKPDDVNAPEVIETIHRVNADAFVVIAFGQKLGPRLLGDTFALNLHASLLPKYRGAAPINRAIINGEEETGISVITLAQRMDAGAICATRSTRIQPQENAGELHDRLAELGPEAIIETLRKYREGTLKLCEQDETQASRAPKFSKADGTVSFDQPATAVAHRIHGLTPWPGCTVLIGEMRLRLIRAETVSDHENHTVAVGTILPDETIACAQGRLRLLEVQPPGSRIMPFSAYCNGHALPANAKLRPTS